jgi:type III secretion regulatory protein HpaA
MSRLRIAGPSVVAVEDPSDAAALAQTQGPQGLQGHHHHHHAHQAQKSANRSRTKRRRGADAQDGIDETGASEELLMMLTEHLQKSSESVMRVGDRHQQEHSGSGGGNDDASSQGDEREVAAASAKGKRFLRGVSSENETEAAKRTAEQGLLEARAAQATALPTASSTYEALKVMLDFLAMPSADVASPARLALVRERLVQAVDKPAGPAPQQQQSANLLLPLLLLNLTRRRTDDERARGTAILKSLLDRRRFAA